MSSRVQILLVEDESGVALVLSDLLRAAGYDVTVASDGPSGLAEADRGGFDLLVLDLLLPGLNGLEVCRSVRQRGFGGAILMLTAKGQIPDRVSGLQAGADDYVVKPFDPDELLARVAALLRRVNRQPLTTTTRFEFGDVMVDFSQQHFTKGGRTVSLAGKEAELLRLLISHRGRVLTREHILSQVWKEQPFITERTVDVHISWLRQKLESNPQSPELILTVRGEGYRFNR